MPLPCFYLDHQTVNTNDIIPSLVTRYNQDKPNKSRPVLVTKWISIIGC